MGSVYSEAGGQLGRCDLHNSLRLPLANLAPFWATSVTISSPTRWTRATRSRTAISMGTAGALEMRVGSIYSEAGGRLGRCDLRDSLRRQLANLAPFGATSVTTSSPTRWLRATRSRMAISTGTVCALKMRVGSIYSEAGGRLGRCDLHNSLRPPLANWRHFGRHQLQLLRLLAG